MHLNVGDWLLLDVHTKPVSSCKAEWQTGSVWTSWTLSMFTQCTQAQQHEDYVPRKGLSERGPASTGVSPERRPASECLTRLTV